MDERALLRALMDGPVSGDALARRFGQTRAAVWKRVRALRDAGVPIQARPGRGYALATSLDLLDAESIRTALPPALQLELQALEVAWSIDSTNSELLRRAPAKLEPGRVEVLLAERQTGGRGRRGRVWVSPLAAHLYLSLARRFEGGLARLGGLSLVAGIATVEALHALGVGQARLKWPNDIVVESGPELRKLGGLLVEGGGEHAGPAHAVIGLGLNVRMPESDAAAAIDQPWCDLAGLSGGTACDRNRLAATLLAHWLPALAMFDAEGLAPFLERYAALDVLRGRQVTLHAESGVRAARVTGLAGDGALQVRLASGGTCSVHSGEVSVRRDVPAPSTEDSA
ncbi:bifunctional biotin--[acetyl-CoA-carboxylase] ligase/biotin operon repressor BirA [Marilutibacter chinensis]|uniref:Bifunctional ligase/repressor BirA n=1 Tax=Marilutibacter chinensis TaxID=2912247 RepID=A0ABS9HR18_9GAMM|nr:bifunctional biotin--[acetyl-CoA-carboxylase] ligase/biotin operon repressor BirA [Lysobacter chinensis]MCF7221394.1 bifunctional biotin--[acetyl-CoA-carboxylase] ligase/biotin operon repressor BirA [Lysobacter chinensis]